MSASPIPIRAYIDAQALVYKEATLSKMEINLVQLAVSVENECHFCVPAHTASALRRDKLDSEIIEAIRRSLPVPNQKIDALVSLSKSLVHNRGKLAGNELRSFYEQGFSEEQLFEILTIVAYKTITNYTSHLMGTKPNPEHREYFWAKS
ncbi:MAG: carboxymuconolactone decarboxylase family protein [Bdellovibrionales bacterium]|nr:carboxymuconolactone decarboxylase family protein [Bdellovibrionales bacterium]